MDSGERAFNIVKWISIIGLSPLLYSFFGGLLLMLVGDFINKLTDNAIDTLLNEQSTTGYAIALIGFIIFLYFLVKREIKKDNIPMTQVNDKFLLGVFFIIIGHLGMGAFYALLIYGQIHGGGSISGIFFIPIIFWMILFYSIGFSIINKQKLLEKLRETNELESHI